MDDNSSNHSAPAYIGHTSHEIIRSKIRANSGQNGRIADPKGLKLISKMEKELFKSRERNKKLLETLESVSRKGFHVQENAKDGMVGLKCLLILQGH